MYRKRRFVKMYDEFADDIYRFLFVHVRVETIAEDLAADTFTRAWQNIGTFDFRYPKAWLYAIARNRLADYWRTLHTVPLEEDFDMPDEREGVEETVDRALQSQQIMQGIAQLSHEMGMVVTLRFLQGLSARETGKVLGMSEGNVRVMQYRALKKLKELL